MMKPLMPQGVEHSQSVTVTPEVLADDRWEPVRCEKGRRVIDVNRYRRQVRWWCDKCRATHIYAFV